MMSMSTADTPASVSENGGSIQKPKTLPCRYCQKRFRRLEHVQRHERTHTKEKPFSCNCGKTFGRRDLLVRHEKLVHSNESTRDTRPAAPQLPESQSSPSNTVHTPTLIDPDLLMPERTNFSMDPMTGKQDNVLLQRTPGGSSLDLLSDAANQLASNDLQMAPSMAQMIPEPRQHDMQYSGLAPNQMPMSNMPYNQGGPPEMEDYNLFLDDFNMANIFLPSSAFDTDLPVSLWARPEFSTPYATRPESQNKARDQNQNQNQNVDENALLGRFESRLPSLQPDGPEAETHHQHINEIAPSGPLWKISAQDHREIQVKLDDFSTVLPHGFTLPSRHTLSRFLEGYINGCHEHLPFLHTATFSVLDLAPELLLTLAAVGAQYRFESHRGNALWYAARAVALEQIRRRNSQQVLEILSPSNADSESTTMSPAPYPVRSSSYLQPDNRGLSGADVENLQNDPRLKPSQARLATIQALLLLMVMGTWASRPLLREALAIQSQLALLVREQGLLQTVTPHEDIGWEEWIQMESDKRTKFIVYSFFNIHCIAYDMPPLLLTSEMKINLPVSAKEWKAVTASSWREAFRANTQPELSFLEAFRKLFAKTPLSSNQPVVSSLGNYVLIHAVVQHIFTLRQTSSASRPETIHSCLTAEAISEMGHALRLWQNGWERTPESSLDPLNPFGPVAFNSTALLRLAYIRLHSDLGPCRRLDTRDPVRIATALKESPHLIRCPRLSRAVLQSAHALSIPVKIGVNFVARTQTFSWSIQHSLCNLECAFLLSKWLETIAMSPMDLTNDERNLLEMVKTMLDETEFAVSFETKDYGSFSERVKIRQLGAAVVRLWAETFKGSHVYHIVKVVGSALDIYADLIEKDNDLALG